MKLGELKYKIIIVKGTKKYLFWEDKDMVSKTFTVKAEEGLHMRPAGIIAGAAGKFSSDVTIVYGDKRINAKSLVNIIAACIKKDSEITFECEGSDEEEALAKMVELEEKNFVE